MSENISEKVVCYNCKKVLEHDPGQKVFRSEDCANCDTALRCCRMCKHFDRHAYNECHEPIAERILEKEKANFCEFFVLSGDKGDEQDKKSLLDAASSLFKD